MFFTLNSKKNVLVYLHDCVARDAELVSLIRQCLTGFDVVWVTKETNQWWLSCGITNGEVFFPTTASEAAIFQNVLRRAMLSRIMSRSQTVILSTSPQILEAATKMLLGTIFLKVDGTAATEINEYGPDFRFERSNMNAISDVLNGNILGYASEVITAPTDCRIAPIGNKNLLMYDWIENPETGTKDYHGGRYFSQKDSRHDLHPLSLRIIDSKKNPRQAASFKHTFAFLIRVATQGNFDLITHVPAKPGERDRFVPFLSGIENYAELQEFKIAPAQVRNDLLTCPNGYDSLKKFGAALRPKIVQGAFQAHADVAGKRIVLVDDVRTTGSTLSECTRTLLGKGAKEVIPITLAYKPFKNFPLLAVSDTPPPTSCCDWPHVVRFNGTSGEPFYGCSAWHYDDRVNHKPGTSSFVNIRKSMLASSDQGLMAYDTLELNSWPDY